MSETNIFLKARWHDLLLITYDIDPELLNEHLPPGLEPDRREGRAFISLVAFDFLNTRVKGLKFPFHVNFPEINLRIYVKNNDRRGVVFIKEFVPRSVIQLIANMFYNEHYKSITMSSEVIKNGKVILNHKIKLGGNFFQISAEADNAPYLPEENSVENFFKEHEWGFGVNRDGKTLMYRVEHPVWKVYPLIKYSTDFDFGVIYGKKWEVLNGKQPYNVTFARGSEVKVFEGKEL